MSDDRKAASMHATGSNTSLVELSEKNFDEIVGGNKPVLVDFWATWCGPCQFMLPIFDKLAKKYGAKVNFGRLNVDDNQGVAGAFGIQSIPTMLIMKGGKVVDVMVGALPKAQIEMKLKQQLSSNSIYG